MILLLSLPNVIFFLLKLSATVLQDLQFLWLLEYKSRILFKKKQNFSAEYCHFVFSVHIYYPNECYRPKP